MEKLNAKPSHQTGGDINAHYRNDIDSLRALAVIPVVFFHAEFSFISGGFIGVDIFFVISGFLITGILLREIRNGSYSLLNFYDRRIRRILPALMVVVVTTLAFGWLILKPEEVDSLAKSAIASIGFSSNIWFWRSSLEYFGPNVSLAPLLHTWSLSVEEQFYILFPLLVLVAHRFGPKYLGRIVLASTLISFLLACFFVYVKPSATFYLLPTRAWELGMGALLAIYSQRISHFVDDFREALSILGLALVLIPMFLYSKLITFPGLFALAPCMGAFIILAIGANGATRTLQVLQWPWLMWIGKISYSLYLVHWPIVVFVRYLSNGSEFNDLTKYLIVLASFLCAIFLWRIVELPFRSKVFNRKKVFINAGLAMSVTAALSVSIITFDESKYPLSVDEKKIAESFSDRAVTPTNCTTFISGEGVCPIGLSGIDADSYDFILFGDSHALSISAEVDKSAKITGRSGLMTSLICPPLLETYRLIAPKCTEYTSSVVNWISNRSDIRTVILHARWAYYESGTDVGGKTGGDKHKLLLVRDAIDSEGMDPHAIFERGFRKMMDSLIASGRKIVIIESVPEAGWDVPNALLLKARWNLSAPQAPSSEDTAFRQAGVKSVFNTYKDHPQVRFVSPSEIMCGKERCIVEYNGVPLYYDDNHLTKSASSLLFREIFIKELSRE